MRPNRERTTAPRGKSADNTGKKVKRRQQHKRHGRKYDKKEGYGTKIKPKETIRLTTFNMDKGISGSHV